MKVLICGGRSYNDWQRIGRVLDSAAPKITMLVHGGAAGADELADAWAYWRKIPTKVYNADWRKHGPAAGPIRNPQMLDNELPDLVIAFPGGKGTRDMITRAKKAGIPVKEVQ